MKRQFDSRPRENSRIRIGRGGERAGFVLLTVLIIVMLSSMVAVSLLYLTRAEATAQAATIQAQQAWTAVWSGVLRATALARASVATGAWREAADSLRHQEIIDDGDQRWFFSVWSEADGGGGEVRFGLSDEASRLNVLAVPAEWLAKLSPDIESVSAGETMAGDRGATSAGSTPLPEEESADGGPLAGAGVAAPELLEGDIGALPSGGGQQGAVLKWLVAQGLGVEVMTGEDANENLRLDPNEDDGDERWPPDDKDGRLQAGWQRFLTDVSYEPNVDSEGRPRINLNDPDALAQARDLPRQTVRYLEALQQAGQRLNHVADLLEAATGLPAPRGASRRRRSGIGAAQLPDLLDRYTATDQPVLRGLVNINTAPVEVLRCLPGVDESLAESIVGARQVLNDTERRTPAWLYTRGLLNAEQFRTLAPYLTTRSYQFRFHCVGYGLPSGRYRVVEAVVDVAGDSPRILMVRDLTAAGFPLPLDLLNGEGGRGSGSVRTGLSRVVRGTSLMAGGLGNVHRFR